MSDPLKPEVERLVREATFAPNETMLRMFERILDQNQAIIELNVRLADMLSSPTLVPNFWNRGLDS